MTNFLFSPMVGVIINNVKKIKFFWCKFHKFLSPQTGKM